MRRGRGEEELSAQQWNKEIPFKAVKTKSNSNIRQLDEIDTLALNNQFKCSEQQQMNFTKEINEAENINTETNTEKAGNKINVYQNKDKIPNRESRRPNKCITEK